MTTLFCAQHSQTWLAVSLVEDGLCLTTVGSCYDDGFTTFVATFPLQHTEVSQKAKSLSLFIRCHTCDVYLGMCRIKMAAPILMY